MVQHMLFQIRSNITRSRCESAGPSASTIGVRSRILIFDLVMVGVEHSSAHLRFRCRGLTSKSVTQVHLRMEVEESDLRQALSAQSATWAGYEKAHVKRSHGLPFFL